ncbi:putative ATP-binding cassette transporter [Thiothrix caldifontis]|uniref:Putative ATP-binding cassette transporter n=1 Tax=Thiothrix caldifontis TaxID=525918 RepID=A0A1H4GTK4_9GAMM|nr:cyclic peptide export ABC transporter [Thiothrix caldifontis]SEB12883.1 putative ATP-binding cassette transporter [Thiothrix caldifontis]
MPTINMPLMRFIERENRSSYWQVLLIATVSGIANSLLLGIINHAAEAVTQNADLTQYFLLYITAFVLFLYGQWYAFGQAIQMVEEAIFNTRSRLTRKVQQVELAFIETQGSNELYSRLTQSDTLISQSIPQIIGAFQMFALMVFSLLYLGYVSVASFVITLLAIGLGVVYFLMQSQAIRAALHTVKQKEESYFASISHLVNGFKEIKVNEQKAKDLLKGITSASHDAQLIKYEVGKLEATIWGFGRLFIYALLPIMVFILPNLLHEQTQDIFKIVATLLFLTGSVTALVNIIPILNRVNLAVEDVFALETTMDNAIAHSQVIAANTVNFQDFNTLSIDCMQFSYPSTTGAAFGVGPFNEKIQRGELLFIIGGNGSGKSTFLKLLTGLYYPQTGGLSVDDTPIDVGTYAAYRRLFSIIFTDFHLFDKFYGVPDVDVQKVNEWLEKMQMQHKVEYKNGGFTSTNLSTGQRKRLAFIAAMLEDRPILVMDEFAADQDPQFRQYFYETLLGEVKSMGKTIIAVTHDDHYFHVADRVWKMDEGRIEKHSLTQ